MALSIRFNDGVDEVHGRSIGPDGYNMGLRYQCVEFMKRYYLERLGHRMPTRSGTRNLSLTESSQMARQPEKKPAAVQERWQRIAGAG